MVMTVNCNADAVDQCMAYTGRYMVKTDRYQRFLHDGPIFLRHLEKNNDDGFFCEGYNYHVSLAPFEDNDLPGLYGSSWFDRRI